MSIFGKLDAEQITTNPFFVEKGEYNAEVTAAEYKFNRDGQRQLFLQYTISEPDSEYDGSKLNQYFDLVDEDMTAEKFELLPAEAKKTAKRNNANLKKTLCGIDGSDKYHGLGVTPDELNNEDWTPASLKGTKIMVGVSNYGPNNTGVNIQWVNLPQD